MALELNDLEAASIITNIMEENAHAERAAETIMGEGGDPSGDEYEDDGPESDDEDANAAPGDAHLQHDILGDDGSVPA